MPRTFYILDGHAHIFRAYYAPFRELTSPTGEPTKATFVFTQMLLNLIAQRKPDYLAMAIDTSDETVFRKQIDPNYKANREKAPPDFGIQAERILRIVKDAGVPIFALPGFEADDLIATMARRLEGQGFDVIIVSKDKDLRQLIDDHTRMYDVQGDAFIDAAAMLADCGYGPEKSIEIQTLTGDATDNVQGIPGVGEKTAAKLIAKYETADAVLEHLDELTPKMRENFEKYADRLKTSRQLVTLRKDVEMNFDPEACAFRGVNAPALKRHLAELGFSNLIKRLGMEPDSPEHPGQTVPQKNAPPPGLFSDSLFDAGAASSPSAAAPPAGTSADCNYRLVNDEATFDRFLAELQSQPLFAFDTETDALGAMKSNLIGMSFSWKGGTGWYVPVKGPPEATILPRQRTLDALKPILENPAIKKVGHNIKYDLLVMRNAGVNLAGIAMDSMIAAFLLDSSRMTYGIDGLALSLLNFKKIATSELIGKGKNQVSMDRLPLEQVSRYASEDADIAHRLAALFRARLDEVPELSKLNDDLETPLISVLADMEFNGVRIDPEVLKQQRAVLAERAEVLRGKIMSAAGTEFNPDSPKQLADVLFNKLALNIVKKNKTGPSTDVEVLEKLADEHPVPKLILEYRSLVKLINTYLDNLPEEINPRTHRIHASFSQIGAATGRLSCSDPNLQNIPIRTDEGQRIRLAFVPDNPARDVLLTADYSQIELRMLAHFTLEPALVAAFERDEDVHAAVAAEVFGVPLDQVSKEQRAQAKIINFGIIYGITAQGLSRRIDGMTIQAARKLIDAYNIRFPGIHSFMQKCVLDAQSQGYVQTILGRRRKIPELASPVLAQRNAGERMAINSVVQGSAADLIKLAMLNIQRRLRHIDSIVRLLMQVHDELVFELPESDAASEAERIRAEMTSAMKLRVPLKVEVGWGKNWQEGK